MQPEHAKKMIFFEPLDTPEGPVSLPDGSWLCVEMGSRKGTVTHIHADGKESGIVAQTGRPNGLAIDKDGSIWVAESSTPSLLRMQVDGSYETWLDGYDGEPFIFPNDLAFGPDGLLYMTDSGINTFQLSPGGKIRKDYLDLSYDGRVYQIDIHTHQIYKLDAALLFANGIAFDMYGNLYVNETITGNVYKYQIQGHDITKRQIFGNVIDPAGPPGWRGPDGMKFGQDGNLYCTVYGQGDITVLDKTGQVTKRINTLGRFPTNLAFGPNGEHKIYVTEVEHNRIETHLVDCAGLELHK